MISIAASLLAAHPDTDVTLIYGNRRSATVMFADEIADLKDRYPSRLQLVHVLSREPQEVELFSGRLDADRLRRLLPATVDVAGVDHWWLCGPFGMVTDAVDVLHELDVVYRRQFGFRVSGNSWYDHAYDDVGSANASTNQHEDGVVDSRGLSSYAERYFNGPSSEVLDAFVFGSVELGEESLLSAKLGSHTQYWGESILAFAHGNSYGQSGLDIAKALAVPGTEAKELFIPRNQISMNLNLTPELSFGAQYFLDWDASRLPESGTAFISVKNQDKARAVEVARGLHQLGFKLTATRGTAAQIEAAGIPVLVVNKVAEGRPNIVDMVKNGEVALVINTVEERRNAIADSRAIRTQSLMNRVTLFTTIAGARAAVEGMQYLRQGLGLQVYPLQELHASLSGK